MSVRTTIERRSRIYSDAVDKIRIADIICKWCGKKENNITIICNCRVQEFIDVYKKKC